MATPVEIAAWVLQAGWGPPGDAATATAVGMRSGSDPAAPGGLFGLGNSGSGAAQASAAYALWASRGKDWNVLPAYAAGGWQLYLPVALGAVGVAAAAMGDDDNPVTTPVQDAASTVAPINPLDSFGRIGEFLQSDEAWMRMIKIILGGGMILIGVTYLTKRSTIDQGQRLVRWIGEHADVISALQGGYTRLKVAGDQKAETANREAARQAKAAQPRPTKRVVKSAGGSAKSGPRPPRRAEPTPWSERPTEERPRVRFVGVAKAPPRKLPGSGEPRVTAEGKKNARAKAGRGKDA